MHAYIVSPSYLSSLTTDHCVLFTINPDTTSIGIKQVRDLLIKLVNTSPIPRIIWIDPADTLTTEASNALLKSLEEPPHNTTFYLATTNPGVLLPTIRSRCQIIASDSKTSSSTSHLQTIKQALSQSPGDRLILAQSLPTDRTELLSWCSELLLQLHATISTTTNPKSLKLLALIAKQLSTLSMQLSANVATSLALGNFFLHLPKVK